MGRSERRTDRIGRGVNRAARDGEREAYRDSGLETYNIIHPRVAMLASPKYFVSFSSMKITDVSVGGRV